MRFLFYCGELLSEILSKFLDFFFLVHVVTLELGGELADNVGREALRTKRIEE